jgi:hypothetical protein
VPQHCEEQNLRRYKTTLFNKKRIAIDDAIDPETIAKNVDSELSDGNWPKESCVP